MTSKEILKKAWDLVHDKYPENNEEIQLVRHAIKTAMELEERNTPMKPLIDKLDLWAEHKCPVCESTVWEVHVHKDENFCSNCGQRLDWSEYNE